MNRSIAPFATCLNSRADRVLREARFFEKNAYPLSPSAFFYNVRLFQNACPLFLALFGFLIHGAFGAEPMRTWSSDNGKFSVKARLLERDGARVRLVGEDGKNISVVTASLSEGDRLYLSTVDVEAFGNTVFLRDGGFSWKVNKEVKGQTKDLAEAIQNAIGEGGREVHLLVGGKLSRTIRLNPGLKLHGHGNTFEKTHDGTGFHREGSGGIGIHHLNLTGGKGWGFHLSRANDLIFENVRITGGGIGIRVESHPSRPWEERRWVRNLSVKDCFFEGCGSHGIETYGVENIKMDGITARNCRDCGVLINKGRNVTIGTVTAHRCGFGGGYAGLRFANNCRDVTVEKLIATECGRGFFTVSNCENIVVVEVTIRDCSSHAILLQNSRKVGINGGIYNGRALNHYTSQDCWIKSKPVEDE